MGFMKPWASPKAKLCSAFSAEGLQKGTPTLGSGSVIKTSGALVEDSSANTYAGSAVDGMNWSTDKFGNASEFSGGKIEIPVGVFNQLTSNQITICVWMYDDGTAATNPGGQSMIYGALAGEDHYCQIGSWNGYLAVKLSAQSADYAGFTKADFCGAWNHWVFVRDANANTIYRNRILFNQANKMVLRGV